MQGYAVPSVIYEGVVDGGATVCPQRPRHGIPFIGLYVFAGAHLRGLIEFPNTVNVLTVSAITYRHLQEEAF